MKFDKRQRAAFRAMAPGEILELLQAALSASWLTGYIMVNPHSSYPIEINLSLSHSQAGLRLLAVLSNS